MLKAAYALILGIFGAGIVHIAILLLLPDFSQNDAWSRLEQVSDLYSTVRLDGAGTAGVSKSADPLFAAVACRFDLSDGPVQVRAPARVPFWSASVYNRGGQNIFSFNDRTAQSGLLDFVVLTPEQMIEARKALPAEFQRSIFVETPPGEGSIVVRAFIPDDSWKPGIETYLASISCAVN